MAQDEAPSMRISGAQPLSTRDGTLAKDAKMVNCFAEQTPEGNIAVKRPGTTLVFAPFANVQYGILGDVVNNSVIGVPYSNAVSGVGRVSVVGVPQGQFLLGGVPFCIINDTVYNSVTGAAYLIPNVTTPGLQYSILSDVPYFSSFLKSSSGLWKISDAPPLTGPTFTKITDSNYPAATVSGLAYLDGTYYVMDNLGQVYGSALQDATTWPALNFIAADTTLGLGAGLVRHLNYLIAFYTHGTQFYYDAGLTPNLPLAPAGNAAWTTGCANGETIKEASDITFFVSKTRQYGRTISKFEGLSLTKISTPPIEKILNLSTLIGAKSFNIKTAGHTFYGLTLVDVNITLVYDVMFDAWHVWTSIVNGVEQHFTGVNYLGSDTQDLFQDSSTGNVVAMSPNSYVDTTGPINFLIRTINHSWGTEKRKRFSALFVSADSLASTLYVRYSDDDYGTFSPYRAVDLNTRRKMLQRCGMSRMRAWDFFHTDNVPLRIFNVELDITTGTT